MNENKVKEDQKKWKKESTARQRAVNENKVKEDQNKIAVPIKEK